MMWRCSSLELAVLLDCCCFVGCTVCFGDCACRQFRLQRVSNTDYNRLAIFGVSHSPFDPKTPLEHSLRFTTPSQHTTNPNPNDDPFSQLSQLYPPRLSSLLEEPSLLLKPAASVAGGVVSTYFIDICIGGASSALESRQAAFNLSEAIYV